MKHGTANLVLLDNADRMDGAKVNIISRTNEEGENINTLCPPGYLSFEARIAGRAHMFGFVA